jgi:ferric-dicitrate binding protein FerR (iron transport regulator)
MDKSIRNIIRDGTSNTATEKQKKEFSTLFHFPEKEFELKNYLLEELEQTEATTESQQRYDELFERWWKNRKLEILVKKRKNYLTIRLTQLAAVLAIGLFLGYYLNSLEKSTSPVYYTAVAPKGSVSEMVLPDGSQIFLNSGSKIKYTIDGTSNKREVFLTGEAWFHVAKLKEKPFLVHTSYYDVQVTGTKFNVKTYPDEKKVVTTLEEGSVNIESSKNMKLEKDIRLKTGEQLVYDKESKRIEIKEVNTRWFTSWKDNKLIFVNLSLKDLKILLERKYGVEIEITDIDILDYHYDGTLKNETILEVLEILKNTLPIQYQIVGQKVIIKKK